MPKLKEPSQRSVRYIANTVAGMNKKQAALAAGYSPATAHNASRAIEIPPVAQSIKEALANEGITLELIAQGLKNGLEAVKEEELNGKTVITIDYAVRHRYLETLIKLQLIKEAGEDVNEPPIPIYGGLSIYPDAAAE